MPKLIRLLGSLKLNNKDLLRQNAYHQPIQKTLFIVDDKLI
jgi:hypothetical protein